VIGVPRGGGGRGTASSFARLYNLTSLCGRRRESELSTRGGSSSNTRGLEGMMGSGDSRQVRPDGG
jgi:hypothetical protein